MSEQVLSSEEVDAILKVTQDKGQDINNLISNPDASNSADGKDYTYALSNINELVLSEFEKDLTAFLRKRVIIKTKSFNLSQVSANLSTDRDKGIYSVFRLKPSEYYGIIIVDTTLLHQSVNLLYGGKLSANDQVIETPGKIGIIIAEKIAQLCLGSFAHACQEYGALASEVIKTTTSLSLASNLGLSSDDSVYVMELSIFFDETETSLRLLIDEDFLIKFIPPKVEGNKHREKDFWRTAIKSQVVDSYVTVTINMPEISLKVKDFMALKDGDILPISDPTMVYVCLNNLKLFRASAGQANSKRVAKIINQI